jgi:endonuclease/exonuclease/phosphatase family metal-dependent hydrolase
MLLWMCDNALPADEPSDAIRVMTYNIRYDNSGDGDDRWIHRKQTVADAIEQHADIAGLQEVLYVQLTELKRLLPEFDAYGVGRDDGKLRGEHSPVFYRKDRFEPLDSGTFWLSPTPDQPGSKGWDAALPRIASWVKLKDKRTGKQLLFVSSHFDHMGNQAREESGKLLAAKLPKLACDLPMILVGDLNTLPDTPPLAALTKVLQDTRGMVKEPTGPDGTWNAFQKIETGNRIDFILVGPGITATAHCTLDPRTPAGRFGSDHLPVQAEITIE